MVDVALMVEGQSGLNWPRWQRLVETAEKLGFAALYRSDHLVAAQPPNEDALELFTSLTWLASTTRRLEFGSLVSPLTFRHPIHLAQTAAALDTLSAGRFTLGLGAGWSRREHEMYGFAMLEPMARLDRLEEGLQVITSLLRAEQPVSFSGQHFCLHDAVLLPRPLRPTSPPILLGGSGRKRSLPLAARFADQWNAMFVSPAQFAALNQHLDLLLVQQGRQPADLRRTVMQGVEVGRTQAQIDAKCEARAWAWWRTAGLFAGLAPSLRARLQEFEQAGADRVILQWLDLDDVDGLHLLADALL
ncbi:MAG TPA: TIGR03560 family F420-dependent LLM class oxidoreductase [Chloroflexota bacterium]|nr:TIGR03560 family F420-dependent LLM class oxidoreductase [Chloroflexota bacterium]